MKTLGKLYVFEGADGVGKSELSARFAAMLNDKGTRAMLLSFPGKEAGTLGKLVYDLHHGAGAHGVATISAASLQLLHIAAHVDAIERVIVPALAAGTTVVLDRFWWSTKVYGLADGSDKRLIKNMIRVERTAWGAVQPSTLFLIRRRTPLRAEPESRWLRWCHLYERSALEEQRRTKIALIDNNDSVEAALEQIALHLRSAANDKMGTVNGQMPLRLSGGAAARNALPSVFSGLAPATPTVVYDTYSGALPQSARRFSSSAGGVSGRLGRRIAFCRNSNSRTLIEPPIASVSF